MLENSFFFLKLLLKKKNYEVQTFCIQPKIDINPFQANVAFQYPLLDNNTHDSVSN